MVIRFPATLVLHGPTTLKIMHSAEITDDEAGQIEVVGDLIYYIDRRRG
jgi:hypothetical protein